MKTEIDKLGRQALITALNVARDQWIKEAQEGLHRSRQDYLSGLTKPKIQGMEGSISLKGDWPVMLEKSFSSFDLKDGFSKSRYKKMGKGGRWYLSIPFRHYTSGYNKMPQAILKVARKLQNGEALEEALVRDLGFSPQVSFTGYQWKNSQFDSLNRIIKEYKNKKSSQYMTFRRVSQKSPAESWQHPGFKGLHAADKVAKKAEEAFYQVLGD